MADTPEATGPVPDSLDLPHLRALAQADVPLDGLTTTVLLDRCQRAEAEVVQLRDIVRGFLDHYRGGYHHDEDGRPRLSDHACAECMAEVGYASGSVVDGFACTYHKARSAMRGSDV